MPATPTGHLIGTCKACKTTSRVPGRFGGIRPCTSCGKPIKTEEIWGNRTNKPCDARCLSAKRASCDCSCGGENHGTKH